MCLTCRQQIHEVNSMHFSLMYIKDTYAWTNSILVTCALYGVMGQWEGQLSTGPPFHVPSSDCYHLWPLSTHSTTSLHARRGACHNDYSMTSEAKIKRYASRVCMRTHTYAYHHTYLRESEEYVEHFDSLSLSAPWCESLRRNKGTRMHKTRIRTSVSELKVLQCTKAKKYTGA